MPRDLFNKLCKVETLKVAANYAHDDKKDDFVPDGFRNQDYIFNLEENLLRLSESLQNGTYRPRPLREIDVPKSGLAVRPGSSIDIEDHIVLFAIAYILAPILDHVLPKNVFHFRLKKSEGRIDPDRLFHNEGPVLVKKTVRRRLRIFEDWYDAWPDFVSEAQTIFEKDGFTFMVESDITAFFENVSHPLLADILRRYAPQQLRLINLLMQMLSVWATPSFTGFRPQRGIPQGNDVSSWLGTLYLVEMDIELLKLQRKGLIKYVRYVDDLKIFAKDQRTARSVLFLINRMLRFLHLNMQSAKTDIYEGELVRKRLYDERVEQVTEIIDNLPRDPTKITHTERQNALSAIKPIYKKHIAYKREIEKEDLRLLKRTLTLLNHIHSDLAVRRALKLIWTQPALTDKLARYVSLWMGRKSVRLEIERAVLGDEELFDSQYIHLLPMLRRSSALDSKHKRPLLALGCQQAHHWAVRSEAFLTLLLFTLNEYDYKRLRGCYFRETSTAVKKAILAIFLKAPHRVKNPMFFATIQEPGEETNRFRKYIWALTYNPELAKPSLAAIRRIEKDPSRMLASLYGALQSRNPDTLRLVRQIADQRAASASSQLTRFAFSDVSADATRLIDDLNKSKAKRG